MTSICLIIYNNGIKGAKKTVKKASCIEKNLDTLTNRIKKVPENFLKFVDTEKLKSKDYIVTWLGREDSLSKNSLNFYMFKKFQENKNGDNRYDYFELNENLNKMYSLEQQLESYEVGVAGIKSFNKNSWIDIARESNGIEGIFEDFDVDLADFRKSLRLRFDIKDRVDYDNFDQYDYFQQLFSSIEKVKKDENLLVVKGKTKEHKISIELARHYIAFKYAFECANFYKWHQDKFNAQAFKEIIKNVSSLLSGSKDVPYRNIQVYVNLGEYNKARWIPEKPEKILDRIDNLANWVVKENRLNPLEKAAVTQAEFIRIHPYMDGNGRVSRVLTNFVLMYNGLSTVSVRYKDTRERYFDCLNKAIEEHDCTDLVNLFYNAEMESSNNVSKCYRYLLDRQAKNEITK